MSNLTEYTIFWKNILHPQQCGRQASSCRFNFLIVAMSEHEVLVVFEHFSEGVLIVTVPDP